MGATDCYRGERFLVSWRVEMSSQFNHSKGVPLDTLISLQRVKSVYDFTAVESRKLFRGLKQ